MRNFEDRRNEGNSAYYLTGDKCIVAGCQGAAGTAWSPLWCVKHNVNRINQIEESMRAAARAVIEATR